MSEQLFSMKVKIRVNGPIQWAWSLSLFIHRLQKFSFKSFCHVFVSWRFLRSNLKVFLHLCPYCSWTPLRVFCPQYPYIVQFYSILFKRESEAAAVVAVQVFIFRKEKNFCTCVRYVSSDNGIVIVNVSGAAAALFFLIILILLVLLLRRKHPKPQPGGGVSRGNIDPSLYAQNKRVRLPDDSEEVDSRIDRHLAGDDEDRTVDSRYNRRLPDDDDEATMDSQYNRRLPDEYSQPGGQQYSRELPDDCSASGEQDTQYNRQLPDDYGENF